MRNYLLKFVRLFSFFEKYGVNYAIFDDSAMYVLGIRKKLRYIEIIIDFDEENIKRFVRLMLNMGMKIKGNIKYKLLPDILKKRESIEEDYLVFYHRRILPWRIKLFLKEDINNYRIVEKKLEDTKLYVLSAEDVFNLKIKDINLRSLQDIHFLRAKFKDVFEKVLSK
ncbi:MAG: hypothetical protein ABDH49_05555 [Candidatus Hydrothermales bacterium]